MTKAETPSSLRTQVFLMNYPLSVSNAVANNAWMIPDQQGQYDLDKAGQQWMSLYQALSTHSIVYLLPGHGNLQDLPFVANVACFLPHRAHDTIVLANFASAPRVGEEEIARRFFGEWDYLVMQPPHCFEGEADLKWVRDNVYIGGIGRSSKLAYRWMRDQFSMDVVDIHLTDPKLYHLDCVFAPLGDKALVNFSVITRADLKKLERVIEIIPVPKEHAYDGWTNSLRIGSTLYHSPARLSTFDKLLEQHGFGLRTFDLSEFDKSGADLSCLVMHLNYRQ